MTTTDYLWAVIDGAALAVCTVLICAVLFVIFCAVLTLTGLNG